MIDNDILNQAANYHPLYITTFPHGNSFHVFENVSMLEKLIAKLSQFWSKFWSKTAKIRFELTQQKTYILTNGCLATCLFIPWESRGIAIICGKVTELFRPNLNTLYVKNLRLYYKPASFHTYESFLWVINMSQKLVQRMDIMTILENNISGSVWIRTGHKFESYRSDELFLYRSKSICLLIFNVSQVSAGLLTYRFSFWNLKHTIFCLKLKKSKNWDSNHLLKKFTKR